MVVDGTEYGEVRQYGNFSFARIYESGHEVPYYQRKSKRASLPQPFQVLTTSPSRGCTGLLQPHFIPLRHRYG